MTKNSFKLDSQRDCFNVLIDFKLRSCAKKTMQLTKLRMKLGVRFAPTQKLAMDKKARQLWELQFSQESELDFREIMQATRQIIWTQTEVNCVSREK